MIPKSPTWGLGLTMKCLDNSVASSQIGIDLRTFLAFVLFPYAHSTLKPLSIQDALQPTSIESYCSYYPGFSSRGCQYVHLLRGFFFLSLSSFWFLPLRFLLFLARFILELEPEWDRKLRGKRERIDQPLSDSPSSFEPELGG